MKLKNYLYEATMFNRNDRVEGKYIDGTKFVGILIDRRFHSYNSNIIIYTIKLDQPYKGRDEIMINWDVKSDKPVDDDAELKLSKKKISKSIISSQKKRQIDKLQQDLQRIPKVFGKGPKADAARKEIEDELKALKGN